MTDQISADTDPADLPTALIELRHARAEIERLRPFVGMADQAQRDAEAAESTNAAAGSYAHRAETAEAALERVRAELADPCAAGLRTRLHHALNDAETVAVAGLTNDEAEAIVGAGLPAGTRLTRAVVDEATQTPRRKIRRPAPAEPPSEKSIPAWTPPPPGDRREQLPDHILTLITIPPYTSTACETAGLLGTTADIHQDRADGITTWANRLHTRCRINNKFTGTLCDCDCHKEQPNRSTTARALVAAAS